MWGRCVLGKDTLANLTLIRYAIFLCLFGERNDKFVKNRRGDVHFFRGLIYLADVCSIFRTDAIVVGLFVIGCVFVSACAMHKYGRQWLTCALQRYIVSPRNRCPLSELR